MKTLSGGRNDLDAQGAQIIVDAIRSKASRQDIVVVGVVGGRSVGGIYGRLRDEADMPWKKVHFFLADERFVPITSDESNFKLVKDDLLGALVRSGRLPEANAHVFILDERLGDYGVSNYTAELVSLGGRFDIAILSAGEDGHTASLFPGHPSVMNDSEHFIVVENSPKPPPMRISAARRLLEKTDTALMVFYGESKRSALDKFGDDSVAVVNCPSKVVIGVHDAYVLTDLE